MTSRMTTALNKPKATARWTGVVGVLVLTSGSYAHSVNSKLIALESAATTAQNLQTAGTLFRQGIVSGLLMGVIFIAYALLLYSLLRPASRRAALLFLLLGLLPMPILLLNQLHLVAAMLAARIPNLELLMFHLELHRYGGFIVSIFFGLWLFPLGYAVYRSGYLPRILGILLMIGCFGYLINFVQGFFFPEQVGSLWTNPALVVTHLAEISLMLWLLVMGVNADRWESRAAKTSISR